MGHEMLLGLPSLRSGQGCFSFGFPPPSQNINLHPGRGLGSELKNTPLSRPGTPCRMETLRSTPRILPVSLESRELFYFPWAVATEDCKPGQQKWIPSHLEALGKDPSTSLLLHLFQLPVVTGIPWLVATSLLSPASIVTRPVG